MENNTAYTPDWFKASAVYQINIRTFSKEGTLASIERELPYLHDLGFRTIYLCPIFEADTSTDRANWSPRQNASLTDNPKNPYRMNDYFKIDEEYGTMSDLEGLVKTAHSLGMKVLLDLVYYHIGPNAPIIERHPEFAQHSDDGSIRYNEYNFIYLNFESAGLREYLWANMVYYVGELDVDGFRCDVGDAVPEDFWLEGRRRIRLIKPDAVLINEGVKYDRIGRSFDTCYHFRWAGSTSDYFSGKTTLVKMTELEKGILSSVPDGGLLLRYVENHDTVTDWKRVEDIAGNDGVEASLVLTYCLPGIPMVYTGNELADAAELSLFANRFHMGAHEVTDRESLKASEAGIRRQAVMRRLNELRRENEALQSAKLEWLENDRPEQVISVRRGDGSVVVVVSMSDAPTEVTLPLDLAVGEVMLEKGAAINGRTVELVAYGYAVLRLCGE